MIKKHYFSFNFILSFFQLFKSFYFYHSGSDTFFRRVNTPAQGGNYKFFVCSRRNYFSRLKLSALPVGHHYRLKPNLKAKTFNFLSAPFNCFVKVL